MKNNCFGRSMIEMLGVLAIVGILSVGAIAGYQKAMMKYKINKTTDQISNIVGNLRTTFANSGNYASLADNPVKTAIKLGVFPENMVTDEDSLKNAYGGAVRLTIVSANGNAHGGFQLTYEGLTKEATVFLATSDWSMDQGSGFIGININGEGGGEVDVPGYDFTLNENGTGTLTATDGSGETIELDSSGVADLLKENSSGAKMVLRYSILAATTAATNDSNNTVSIAFQ